MKLYKRQGTYYCDFLVAGRRYRRSLKTGSRATDQKIANFLRDLILEWEYSNSKVIAWWSSPGWTWSPSKRS